MKTKLAAAMLFLFINVISAQVITWSPVYATEDDSITVWFDATKGTAGLKGYTGDVYAHTGVLTDASASSSAWKSVRSSWGTNLPSLKLRRISNNLYEFKIKPSVKSFYPLSAGEGTQYLKVAFVFRSGAMVNGSYLEGKETGGKDIFLLLRLGISLLKPAAKPVFADLNSKIPVVAAGSSVIDTMKLYVNNSLIYKTTADTLKYDISADAYGKNHVKVVGIGSGIAVADSFYYVVNKSLNVSSLPAGIVDGINYTGSTSVTLSLYAPYKKFVYVIGDFNNWEADPDYYMNISPDGSRYWITINNLTPRTEYAFQYYVDGELKIADPYTEKILDASNDPYIPPTVYPNLKPYPAGKTENAVSIIETDRPAYQWQVSNFQKPAETNLVIYELLVRDFVSTHWYQTLIDTLSYLKTLGVNAIELMPIMEFEGNSSWGYNPSFHLAPDKYYGTREELKKFIDECHKNGIAVILDMVLNHAFGESPLVKLYWDAANNRPAANSPWFNPIPKHDYNVGYDFNHESPATQYFVDRVVSFWLQNYKFDGFRFDLSKGFTQTNTLGNTAAWGQYDQSRVNIWKRIYDKIRSVDPTAYVILEHFANNDEEMTLSNYGMMLWGNLNYNYNEATMGWTPTSDFSNISYKNRGWGDAHLVGYMESHDEERLMYKNILYGNFVGYLSSNPNYYNPTRDGSGRIIYSIRELSTALARIKLAAAFFLTIPGPKMIWQFGELGYDYSINYNGRLGEKPIRWDYMQDDFRKNLYKTFSALIKLKKDYPAFSSSNFTTGLSGNIKHIAITDASMDVMIVGNFGITATSATPAFQHTGTWYDYATGNSYSVTSNNLQLNLEPGEFHIFTDKQLPVPEQGILADAEPIDETVPQNFILEQNYPNPFNPETTIKFSIPTVLGNATPSTGQAFEFPTRVSLKIYNILGREVAALVNENKSPGNYEIKFDASGLPSGVYLYRLTAGNYSAARKMILLK